MLNIKHRTIISSTLASLAFFGFVNIAPAQYPETKTYAQVVEVQKKKDKLKDVYGYENVHLKTLQDIAYEEADETYKLPSDLEKIIKGSGYFQSMTKVKDKERFKKKVLAIAEKLGYKEERIKNLKPKEAIKLAAGIVAENYEYKLVEYEDKSIDEIFEIGKVKCTEYTYSTTAVFSMFKEANTNLKNVYVIDHHFYEPINHAWNTVIVVNKENIQVAYLDVTWYDFGAELNATDKQHLNFERWRLKLYEELRDYDAIQKEIKSLSEKTRDQERLEELLEKSAYYYEEQTDCHNYLGVYKRLVEEFPNSKNRDRHIYHMGWSYYMLKDYDNARECVKRLRKEHPGTLYPVEYLERLVKEATQSLKNH